LYITKDQTKTLTNTKTRIVGVTTNIIEITITYPSRKNKLFDAIYSNLTYLQLLNKYAGIIKKHFGKPLLLHAYIVIRGGLGGMLLATRWKLPFILSENWTIYYPNDPGYLLKRDFFFKAVVKKVFNRVNRFLPVSRNLQQQVDKILHPVPSTIIPNVVKTNLFYHSSQAVNNQPFRFIHVSTMTYQKNPEGLLRSFKSFNAAKTGSCLWMVGPYPQEVLKYARELGLGDDLVHFTGLVSYTEVAEFIMHSQALVMFSRYENLPCVILEALCCGLPVISTTVGGIAEVVGADNGALLDNENEEQLTAALTQMFTGYNKYNSKNISEVATRLYNYEAVGQLINAVYLDVINKVLFVNS